MTENQAMRILARPIFRSSPTVEANSTPETHLVDGPCFDSLAAAEPVAAVHQESGHRPNVPSPGDFQTVGGTARIPAADAVGAPA